MGKILLMLKYCDKPMGKSKCIMHTHAYIIMCVCVCACRSVIIIVILE